MARPLDPAEIPEEVTRFAEALVAEGKFESIAAVLLAGKEALELREVLDAERARLLRAAWDEGMQSLLTHGPQLESDEEFEAFMDDAVAEALR